jgi:hypothetical protein
MTKKQKRNKRMFNSVMKRNKNKIKRAGETEKPIVNCGAFGSKRDFE